MEKKEKRTSTDILRLKHELSELLGVCFDDDNVSRVRLDFIRDGCELSMDGDSWQTRPRPYSRSLRQSVYLDFYLPGYSYASLIGKAKNNERPNLLNSCDPCMVLRTTRTRYMLSLWWLPEPNEPYRGP